MSESTLEGAEMREEMFEVEEISRWDTGIRILLTLLFALIWGVVETVLAVVVIFGLLWALITEQAPPLRVREFGNRLVAYGYRLGRYVTHNEAKVPFPFSEFPAEVEPPDDLGRDEAVEIRGLLDRKRERYADSDPDADLD